MYQVTFFIAILALALFLYGPWQVFWQDFGRQRLFEIRDSVFDLAKDGRIDFRDKRYVAIRMSLNYTIRFMHEMTWPRIAYIVFNSRSLGVELKKSVLEEAVSQIEDTDLRETLEKKMEEVGKVMLMVIIGRSPFITLCVASIVPLVLTSAIVIDTYGLIRKASRQSFRYLQRDVEIIESALTAH